MIFSVNSQGENCHEKNHPVFYNSHFFSFETKKAFADSLIVSGTVTIRSDTTFDYVEVQSGGTLIADGEVTVSGDMVIQSGGVVTHSARLQAGLQLKVTGTLDINAGGKIDVTAKGLLGGANGSAFGLNGEAYNDVGEIVAGASGDAYYIGGNGSAAGASYGGLGFRSAMSGDTNPAYGLLESPQNVGSGGGAGTGPNGTVPGGNGGGRVTINAANLIINGMVVANGGNGIFSFGIAPSGPGSGGAILINAGTVSGTGQIIARGGHGFGYNGQGTNGCKSGGGGRIASYSDNFQFPAENISAQAGDGYDKGSAGTIYLWENSQTNGDLIIDNGNIISALSTPLRTSLTDFGSIAIKNKARLLVQEDLTLKDSSELEIDLHNSATYASSIYPLKVFGTAKCAGSLKINLLNGYIPTISDTLVIMEYNSLQGSFATLPDYPDRLHMRYTDNNLIAFIGDRRSYANDVGGLSMITPKDTVTLNKTIIPRTLVQNYGYIRQTTPACLAIGQSYIDTASVAVNPFAVDTANFKEWKASILGAHSFTNKTLLIDDQDATNDEFLGVVAVIRSTDEPVITDLYPRRGGNTGYITLNLSGRNFKQGAIVRLSKAGEPDIVADSSSVQVIGSTNIIASFDLREASLGFWDIVVTNPDGLEAIFYKGFKLEQNDVSDYNNLFVKVVVRPQVRGDRMTTVWIEVGNTGIVDEYDIMLIIKLPRDFTYQLNLPEPLNININWSNIPQGGLVDDQIIIPVWIYSIPALSNSKLSMLIQPPSYAYAHQFFTLEAELLPACVGPFRVSGSRDFVTTSSIFTHIFSSYETQFFEYPDIFTIPVSDFLDSLILLLRTEKKRDDYVPYCHFVVSLIQKIITNTIPTSILAQIATNVPSLVMNYFYYYNRDRSLARSIIFDCTPDDKCGNDNCVPEFPDDACVRYAYGKSQRYCTKRGKDPNIYYHAGVDYAAEPGTPIKSPVDGTWFRAYPDGTEPACDIKKGHGWGYAVFIKDTCDNCWVFAHLAEKPTRPRPPGYAVKKGDIIGVSGTTCADGTEPHVHVEYLCNCNQKTKANPDKGRKKTPSYPDCPPPPPPPSTPSGPASFEVVFSCDPNAKSGLQGIGEEKYTRLANELPFIIFCENVDTASAAAQEVLIIDTLDVEKMNLGSFSFGPISFGTNVITPPPRTKQFAGSVDFRPNDTLLVNVNAQFDTLTGVALWHFQAIDPNTGKPPEDPQKGVLPPNVISPKGEGSVSFNIIPKDSLSFGTKILNRASIIFDTNPAIATNEWINTIDNQKPISQVALLDTVINYTDFLVSWSGTDEGAGIQKYTIFVSEDNGDFFPWLVNTTDTTAVFQGEFEKMYAFYSIARGSVGNIELPKNTADTYTFITSVTNPVNAIPKQYGLSQNYPNPFNPITMFDYQLPTQSKVTFTIYNALGQQVKILVDRVQEAGHYSIYWDALNYASGVYFYRIKAMSVTEPGKTFEHVKKMLLLK